jgi:hypothetical protein
MDPANQQLQQHADHLSQSASYIDCAPHAICPTIHPGADLASFMHSVGMRANREKSAHHSLCNPKTTTLLKAVRRGFLKGCPNLTKKLILKYLNRNPATANGHMKRPRHGIKSTQPKQAMPCVMQPVPPIAIVPPPAMDAAPIHDIILHQPLPHLIDNDCNKLIANVFVLAHLQIPILVSYTMTSRETFPSCCLTEA